MRSGRKCLLTGIPEESLKKAKIIAAKSDKSVSELIREAMEEKIEESTGYQRPKQKHLMILRKGIDMGTKGNIAISREELHARR